MAEPNLDLGLDYTGGIEKPTLADVGRFARVALDATGDPNFEYVDGVERRLAYSQGAGNVAVTTSKTVVNTAYTVPAGKLVDGAKSRLRVVIHGEFPARVGTKVGVDFFGNAISFEADLIAAASLPPSATTPFDYELIVYPGSATTQRVFGKLRISTLPVIETGTLYSPAGIDFTVAQDVRVTGQLANGADTLTFRRVEVFGIGL